MHNPFKDILDRLDKMEALLVQRLTSSIVGPAAPEVGGIELAQAITRLSKPRIYALVSARGIPVAKRGNKLYFNRADLMDWVNAGKRSENETVTNA